MRKREIIINIPLPAANSPSWRWAAIAILVLSAITAAYGADFSPFSSGEQLTSAKMNANLKALQDRIAAIESATPLVAPGTVVAFAGNTAPQGWLLCDGSPVSRTTYSALFAAIGNTAGGGDGTTTFNLPDYRGYFLRGLDATATRDPDSASRTSLNPGGGSGASVSSFESDAFASHTHPAQANADFLVISSVHLGAEIDGLGTGSYFQPYDGAAPATGTSGGSETRPKNVAVNYIVKY